MGLISNGTTLLDAGAIDSGVSTGSLIHIKTLTASSSGTLSFVHGSANVVLDGTYKEYIFKFINIHPQGDVEDLQFNLSIDGGSNYNVTKTSTAFKAWHWEDDSETSLYYDTARDLAQSTAFKVIGNALGSDADQGTSGTLHLFNPSSTVFVKHWCSRLHMHHSNNGAYDYFTSGYGNTTSAINSVQFKMANLNIDEGIIKLYGVT